MHNDFDFEPELRKLLSEAVGTPKMGRSSRLRQVAPKFVKFDEFSWEKFFRAYKLSEKSSAKSWTERIQAYSGNLECYWALRFLIAPATNYCESAAYETCSSLKYDFTRSGED